MTQQKRRFKNQFGDVISSPGSFDKPTLDTLKVSQVRRRPLTCKHTHSITQRRVKWYLYLTGAVFFPPAPWKCENLNVCQAVRGVWIPRSAFKNTFSHGHWSAPDVLIGCTWMLRFTRAELPYWHSSRSHRWPCAAYYTPWNERAWRASVILHNIYDIYYQWIKKKTSFITDSFPVSVSGGFFPLRPCFAGYRMVLGDTERSVVAHIVYLWELRHHSLKFCSNFPPGQQFLIKILLNYG